MWGVQMHPLCFWCQMKSARCQRHATQPPLQSPWKGSCITLPAGQVSPPTLSLIKRLNMAPLGWQKVDWCPEGCLMPALWEPGVCLFSECLGHPLKLQLGGRGCALLGKLAKRGPQRRNEESGVQEAAVPWGHPPAVPSSSAA